MMARVWPLCVVAVAACGRIGLDATALGTGDGGPNGNGGDGAPATGDGTTAGRFTWLGGFSGFNSNHKTDTFVIQARTTGDAIAIAVGCAGSTLPTGVTITATGWTFTPLSPISGTAQGPWAATFGAMAPST